MKVYKSNYRDHWISPYKVLEKVFFWREIDYDEPIIDKWSDRLLPICVAIQKVLDFIHPQIDYVKIDHYDVWSMDHTLSNIILPMLKKLKETKQGSPMVDDEDVPFELRSYCAWPVDDHDIDDNFHKRWEYVLDEMIWAFEQNVDDTSEDKFWDHSQAVKSKKVLDNIGKIKCDWDGLKAHGERKANGFRLFGKYYQGLWD